MLEVAFTAIVPFSFKFILDDGLVGRSGRLALAGLGRRRAAMGNPVAPRRRTLKERARAAPRDHAASRECHHMDRGVFATRRIPKGSASWLLDPLDQVLTPAAVDRLPPACRA